MLKRCSKCLEMKSREQFSNDGSKRDGLTSACKECNSKRDKIRRVNGGYFTSKQKQEALKKYNRLCQLCNSPSNLEVDHKLAQFLCESKTSNNDYNAWVLCKRCNIAKGARVLIEVIQSIPKDVLGPMLLRELAHKIVEGAYEKVPFKVGERVFTEVRFKME